MKDINTPEAAAFLWENSREGIAILTPNGTIQYANPRLCEILGYTDVELIGMHFTEITATADQAADSIKFKELTEGVISQYKMAKRLRTRLGKAIPGELLAKKWVDGILIFGSVLPLDPLVRAAMGDTDAQKMLDESIGRWLRQLPTNVIKNWRTWLVISMLISGALGVKELTLLL